jgi:hypothetical protein
MGRDRQPGHLVGDISEVGEAHLFQVRGAEGGDRERHRLHLLLALQCGDDDLLDAVRLSPCVRIGATTTADCLRGSTTTSASSRNSN